MRQLLSAPVLAFVLCLAPAYASGGGGGGEEPAKEQGNPNVIELPMLVAPVTVDERLYHYAYMRIQLTAKDAEAAAKAREKVPYIIDAMLREVHKSSIALDGDPKHIDGDGLHDRLLVAAESIMGKGMFTDLEFRDTIATDESGAIAPTSEGETGGHETPPPAKATGGH